MTGTKSNASASASGWSFQVNAAIILSLKFIKLLEKVRVEGKFEDIEITTEGGDKIYIQAKSVVTPDDTSNVLSNLKKSLKTLSSAASKHKYNYLILTTNSSKPFNKKDSYIYFNKNYQFYNINELPNEYISTVRNYLDNLNKAGNDITAFDVDRFYLHVFSLYGEDYETRYYTVLQTIGDFLNQIGVRYTSKIELLTYWQSLFFENSTKKNIEIEMSKEELVWPIIVLESVISKNESIFEDYVEGDIEDVLHSYNRLINYQTSRFPLVLRITADFSEFLVKTGKNRGKTSIITFIDSYYRQYESEILPIVSETMTMAIREILIKVTIMKILEIENKINTIKSEVNLI
ncbi:hypothetical protein PT126_03405 [Erysipelothrix rhusiopathiae]|nr:hypothetical protein [Erysipelothrix rhusiopathiae]MDE8193153.1 hypothetical protein [Erysipelothrix rhusiopathiae]